MKLNPEYKNLIGDLGGIQQEYSTVEYNDSSHSNKYYDNNNDMLDDRESENESVLLHSTAT